MTTMPKKKIDFVEVEETGPACSRLLLLPIFRRGLSSSSKLASPHWVSQTSLRWQWWRWQSWRNCWLHRSILWRWSWWIWIQIWINHSEYSLLDDKEWILQGHPDQFQHPLPFRKDQSLIKWNAQSQKQPKQSGFPSEQNSTTFQRWPVSPRVGVCQTIAVAAALRLSLLNRGFSSQSADTSQRRGRPL